MRWIVQRSYTVRPVIKVRYNESGNQDLPKLHTRISDQTKTAAPERSSVLDFASVIPKSNMREETKVCQNGQASFLVDASDFAFYEKM